MRRLVLLLAGVLALAACGTDPASDDPDVTGEWQLASGTTVGADLAFPPGATATLALSGGKASGVAFCNHYSASYEQDGSSFSIDGLGQTEMGCEPDVMAAERTYLAALALADTAVLDGADLLLTGAGVELRFGPAPAVPDSPLEGTRWVLESLVDGETASTTLGDPAGCPPDLVRQDEHVTAVLQAGPAVEPHEDRLTLTAPDGRGLVYRAG